MKESSVAVDLPEGWHRVPAADERCVSGLAAVASVRLPSDYLAFLRRCNGGEGVVAGRYVSLWPGEEVGALNQAYGVPQYMPGALAFGTDGGDQGYCFDGREGASDPPILSVGLGNLGFDDARRIAGDFTELLALGVAKPDERD